MLVSDPSGSNNRLPARLATFFEEVRELLASCQEILPKVQACVGQVERINRLIDERQFLLRAEEDGETDRTAQAEGLHQHIERAYKPFLAVQAEARAFAGSLAELMSRVPGTFGPLLSIRDEIAAIPLCKGTQWPLSMHALHRDLRSIELRLEEMLEAAASSSSGPAPETEETAGPKPSPKAAESRHGLFTPEALKATRRKRRQSQQDMAEELEVSVSTVSRWERGVIRALRPEHLQAIEAYIRAADETASPGQQEPKN